MQKTLAVKYCQFQEKYSFKGFPQTNGNEKQIP